MSALIWSVGASIVVSLIAFFGAITLMLKDKLLNKILLILVGFSAGTLMGAAFLHLIPEAAEKLPISMISLYLLIGFSSFFLIERVLYWHHCHSKGGKCDVHTFSYMNLIGDGVHNFIDGTIMAAGFVISIPTGIAATLAIIAHEIPQEISDFGVLVYGGFSKAKALFFNFLSALTAIVGAVLGFFLSQSVSWFTAFLIPFAAGGFIYIAAADLIPELHKEPDLKKSLVYFAFFLGGIIFMSVVKVMFGH